jgi:anti-sigma regulatory factor (Ser/Thr protein kinase)
MCDGVEVELAIPSDVAMAQRVRHAVADEFACLGDALPAAKVIVSELVTNAVLHGAAPIRMRAKGRAGVVRFEIYDSCPDFGPPVAESRGVTMVDALAQRWGFEPVDGGKVVWAEVRSS